MNIFVKCRVRTSAHIRTSEHHILSRPRLSVRMFGSWGTRRFACLVQICCRSPIVERLVLESTRPRCKIRLQWTTKNGDPDRNVAQRLGYDLNRGRLDLTHHPFSTRFSTGDVRITTHVNENDLGDVLFSTLHEAGHAMYEQGISAALDGTPLGKGVSAGVHESQSRLWENVVGRSRGFWEHFYPSLQRVFPEQLGSVPIAVPVK
jgi:Zn-dependent M32 family carboxypeptidase